MKCYETISKYEWNVFVLYMGDVRIWIWVMGMVFKLETKIMNFMSVFFSKKI
jgi:hypothetical protein